MVGPREAQGTVRAGRAQAMEPIDFVQTRPSAHAGVRAALIDLHFTFQSYQKYIGKDLEYDEWCRCKVISCASKHTSVFTQIRYLVKPTCISRAAQTFVLVDPILALSILTGVAGTVVFIDLTIHP